MGGGEGMVAVVRGLRDSGLAVTLLDGNKQYTLMPTSANNAMQPGTMSSVRMMHDVASQKSNSFDGCEPTRCDSAAQATDGRYMTMYKTAHCNVIPTSPPVELAEFPPQRAELYRGATGTSRDREPDAFADSLRKYPNLLTEPSADMVERLIDYTQTKDLSKSYRNRSSPSSRYGIDRSSVVAVPERGTSRNSHRNVSYQKNFGPKTLSNEQSDMHSVNESPTRDVCARTEVLDSKRFGAGNFDAKNLKDVNKRGRGCNDDPAAYERTSVNTEVQAAAEMVSKQVATVPRIQREKRTISVALSPSTSSHNQKCKGEVSTQVMPHKPNLPYKSTQTCIQQNDFTVQTEMENTVTERKSKSEDIIATDMKLETEIMGVLESACPNEDSTIDDVRLKILKRMSAKLQKLARNLMRNQHGRETKDAIGKILKNAPIWVPFSNFESYMDAVAQEIFEKIKCFVTVKDMYRDEVSPIQLSIHGELEQVIQKWIEILPRDSLGLSEKKEIITSYADFLNTLFVSKLDTNCCLLRSELLSIVSKMPLKIKECHKIGYFNKLIDLLIIKFKEITDPQSISSHNANSKHKIYVQPTENELKKVLKSNINIFFGSHVSDTNIRNYLESELIDILIEAIPALRLDDNKKIEDIIVTLFQEVSDVTENDVRRFANELFSHLNKYFTEQSSYFPIIPIQNYVVLQAATNDTKQEKESTQNNASFEETIGRITKQDLDRNLDAYINLLSHQIEEWLQNSQMSIPDGHDKKFRQLAIDDLAGDIVDRYKYLELNPSSKGSEDDELEHLKYRVFRWINKFAGEENMETLKHAPELMRRIQSIPLPMLTIPQHISDIKTSNVVVSSFSQSKNNRITNIDDNTSLNAMASSSGFDANTSLPSIKQLNDDYDKFLKDWIEELPMPSDTPEQIAVADKTKQSIYNSVWKVLTKLKFDQVVFHDKFYYEDALESEIDKLLNSLPQSPELNSKKHYLKIKLIKETTNTNKLILDSFAPASLKQQLIEIVSQNLLPNKMFYNKNESNNDKATEYLQIEKIVDDYILCMKYKQVPQFEIYRSKLLKEVQSIIENIKKSHGRDLKDINTDLYINNVISALQKVPLPSEEIISKEVEDVQIAKEIQQWFIDLSIIPEDEQGNQLKSCFVKRIIDLKNDTNIHNSLDENALKNEVILFLTKFSYSQQEKLNMDFMADELINRIKNKIRDIQDDENERQKSVAFRDSVGYYEFSLQMPGCSSFIDAPDKPALINQSSYIIRDGEKIKITPNDTLKLSAFNHIPAPNEYFVDSPAANSKPQQTEISYHTIPHSQDILDRVRANTLANSELARHLPSCCPNEDRQISNQGASAPCVTSQAKMYKTVRGDHSFIPQASPIRIDARTASSYGLRGEGNKAPLQYTDHPYPNLISGHAQINRQNYEQFGPKPHEVSDHRFSPTQEALHIRDHTPTSVRSSQITPKMTANTNHRKGLTRINSKEFSGENNIISSDTYGQPQGYSTPQQSITEISPERPDKKKNRRQPRRYQSNFAKRRLALDSDSTSDNSDDLDSNEPCICMKRMLRHRTGLPHYKYKDFDIEGPIFRPYFYPCPFFYF